MSEMNKEDMNVARVELNEQNLEDVVGGNFNWYTKKATGKQMCLVTGVGNYYVSSSAESRYNSLRLQHKHDNWTEAQYVDVLLAEGKFSTSPLD